MTTGRRDRLLWGVVALSAALTIITLVASRFATPDLPRGMRALPRIPRPPVSTGDLLRSLGVGSLIWYACFLSAPLLVAMSRRFPLDRRRWLSSIAAHIVVLGLLVTITAALQYRLSYHGSPFAPSMVEYLKVAAIAGTLPFLTVAVAAHALEARVRAHERELEAERVRGQLAESRLEALTAQLQPHFLFNTLQGISALIREDPEGADAMLASLSDLLRDVLRRGSTREVELCEEMRVLQSYLDISRRRFGERLTIDVAIADDASHALVPFFILQPLVENALHHGVSKHAGAGRVEIRARREGSRLLLNVIDDGPGPRSRGNGRGIGLTNTRARLAEMYGNSSTLDATGEPDGFRVTVALPFHERESSADVS